MVCLLFIAASAHASTIEPLDLTTLNGQSTHIVVGYVTSIQKTKEQPGFYEKIATIRVTSVLKGTWTAKSLRIRMRSGLVFFDRFLEKGDSGVFFLKPLDGQTFEAAYPGSFALFDRSRVRDL